MRSILWLLGIAFVPVATLAEGNYAEVQIDEDEYRTLIETSQELERYFDHQSVIHSDEELVTLVREIGHNLTPPPTDDYISYEFFVLRDPSPNAFALPNGHIYVTTGMLARLENDAQLAALLSHEINHVAGHHSILNDRSSTKKQVAIAVFSGLGGLAGANYDVYGDISSAWAELIATVISQSLAASIYGFSRELEQEADDRAVLLLLDSPYDTDAMPEVLEILRLDYEGLNPRVPTMWSTHPELDLRIALADQRTPNLPNRDRESDAFQIAMRELRILTIRDYIQDDYPQTALALAQSFVERYPEDAQARQLLADAWQAMGSQTPINPYQWTERDKQRNIRQRARRTREQRLSESLETDEGRAAYSSNLSKAEETYREVLELNPDFAAAYRGLGEVYEKLDKYEEAADAYLRYARAAPDAPDRAIVINRLRTLSENLRKVE